MKKISLLLILSLLTVLSQAQVDADLDGKYIGKFYQGAFEDSIIIEGNRMTLVKNRAWGYGIQNTYIYQMTFEEDDMISFKQIRYYRDGKRVLSKGNKGYFDEKEAQLNLIDRQHLQIIHLTNSEYIITFQRTDITQ